MTPAGKRDEKTKENEGKSWNDRKKVGKKRRKIVENMVKMEENGGMRRKKTIENEGKSSKAGGKTEENGGMTGKR